MSKKIAKSQRRFIRDNYQSLSIEQMAEKLKITTGEAKQALKDLNLKVSQQSTFSKDEESFFDKYPVPLLSFFTIAYIAFFYFICVLRYRAFDYTDFDLAIYAQAVYNILHSSMQSSILGIPFLGNHLDLLLFPIAPIYAIFPTPLTLLFLQTLFLGLGVIPLFLLTKDVLDRRFAFLFGVLYLFYPALTYIGQYEFHPVAFVTFFLLYMFYFFQKSRFVPFLCFMFLSLLCKENIPLGIFFFGLYVLIFGRRDKKWGIVPLVASILWLVIGVKILHGLNQGTIDFNYIYRHMGKSMPEVVANIFIHPGTTLKYLFAKANMQLLLQLFLPLGFLCLLSPKTLFMALPFLLQQMLSSRVEDHTIEYHYIAKLIPFLFFSAIYGLRSALQLNFIKRHKVILTVFLLASCVVSNIWFGLLPKLPEHFSERYAMKDKNYFEQEFVDKVPRDAAVVATFAFLPKLAQRKEIHSFHHVFIGTYTLSQKKYILPEDVNYALLDFDDYLTFTSFYIPENYKRLNDLFTKDKWGLIAMADNIGLFKKGEEIGLAPYQILTEPASLSSTRLNIEDNVTALGYSIENNRVSAGGIVPISFIWQCNQETKKDYWLSLQLVDKKGIMLYQFNHPICYRIYPTFAWKKGDIIKENIWMIVPRKLKVKEAWIKMLVLDRNSIGLKGGMAQAINVSANVDIFDEGGRINLGKIDIVSD